MPTYEYRCVSCEHQFERFQRMSDEPVKECEVCGQPVKRLLFPVAIQFKGSGFYTTDYGRRSTLGAAGTQTANGGSDSSAGTGGGSERSGSDSSGSDGSGSNGAVAGSRSTPPVTKTSTPVAAAATSSD